MGKENKPSNIVQFPEGKIFRTPEEIEEQKKARELNESSEDRLRQVFENFVEALNDWVSSKEGEFAADSVKKLCDYEKYIKFLEDMKIGDFDGRDVIIPALGAVSISEKLHPQMSHFVELFSRYFEDDTNGEKSIECIKDLAHLLEEFTANFGKILTKKADDGIFDRKDIIPLIHFHKIRLMEKFIDINYQEVNPKEIVGSMLKAKIIILFFEQASERDEDNRGLFDEWLKDPYVLLEALRGLEGRRFFFVPEEGEPVYLEKLKKEDVSSIETAMTEDIESKNPGIHSKFADKKAKNILEGVNRYGQMPLKSMKGYIGKLVDTPEEFDKLMNRILDSD
ncbi:MAG: hypothetical protein GF347_02220 [Candidatus Moranbacteria bacterium]|nr:hypothetical protein [Candidatus Moranbacteria bacterium]